MSGKKKKGFSHKFLNHDGSRMFVKLEHYANGKEAYIKKRMKH